MKLLKKNVLLFINNRILVLEDFNMESLKRDIFHIARSQKFIYLFLDIGLSDFCIAFDGITNSGMPNGYAF